MTDEEKTIRLNAIRKHARLLRKRYGYNNCPENLKPVFEEVLTALTFRAIEVLEG